MPYNRPNRESAQTGSKLSIASNHSVAVLLLAAVVILWALRHVFGTVSVSAGTR